MKFEEVLDALRNGERLTNATLSNNSSWIARHVPTYVENEIIPKMNSLPEGVKGFLKGRGDLRFEDQVLLFPGALCRKHISLPATFLHGMISSVPTGLYAKTFFLACS